MEDWKRFLLAIAYKANEMGWDNTLFLFLLFYLFVCYRNSLEFYIAITLHWKLFLGIIFFCIFLGIVDHFCHFFHLLYLKLRHYILMNSSPFIQRTFIRIVGDQAIAAIKYRAYEATLPRFVRKAHYVMYRRSALYQHYCLKNAADYSLAISLAIAIISALLSPEGLFWWSSTIFPWIALISFFCSTRLWLNSESYYETFTKEMNRRYEAKYKDKDENP